MEPEKKTRILVVDDEHLIRWSLRQRLEQEGYEVLEAATGAEALDRFQRGVHLVLLDWLLPDVNGLEVFRRMRAIDTAPPVIMLTAHSSVQRAVTMMREGAYHYAGKPFDLDEVVETVRRALESNRHRFAISRIGGESSVDGIVGDSSVVRELKDLLLRIAQSPSSTVLITGESGTGKALAAKAIHNASERKDGPFLNITCSALPSTLLESELFGHERGAFTDAKTEKKGLLEHAHGGTVFLDEIGEMEPSVQGKLLRFLEDKTFRRVGGAADIRADVRVIAATNVDLRAAVARKAFREDLYYRLAVLTVRLPALRERRGDVGLLTRHFVDQFNQEFGKEVRGLTPAAMERLEAATWPGNVRELKNTVERAVLLCDRDHLDVDAFELPAEEGGTASAFTLPPNGVDMQELERRLLVQALERANGNRTRAGALLGMNRDQIRYRIEKFNLEGEGLDPRSRGDEASG
jgi:two-component system response regulator AtoC